MSTFGIGIGGNLLASLTWHFVEPFLNEKQAAAAVEKAVHDAFEAEVNRLAAAASADPTHVMQVLDYALPPDLSQIVADYAAVFDTATTISPENDDVVQGLVGRLETAGLDLATLPIDLGELLGAVPVAARRRLQSTAMKPDSPLYNRVSLSQIGRIRERLDYLCARLDLPTPSTSAPAIAPAEHDQQLRQYVSGSRRLTYRDMIETADLLVPFGWKGQAFAAGETLTDQIVHGMIDGERLLVVSPPGFGKSLLTMLLTYDPPPSAAEISIVRLDLYDLRHLRGDADFGSLQWLEANDLSLAPGVCMVLDSIDEFFEGADHALIADVLGRPLFARAQLATCRSAFYAQNVLGSRFAESRRIVEIENWSPDEVRRFVQVYMRIAASRRQIPQHDHEEIARRVAEDLVSESRTALASSPLRIVMALELVDDEHPWVGTLEDVLSLYRRHSNAVLHREAAKPGVRLTADRMAELLSDVAMHFFDDIDPGVEPVPFTNNELRAALALVTPGSAVAAQTLVEHSLLDVRPDGHLAFAHRTIHDYFIAARLFAAIEGGADDVFWFFTRLSSPVVSEFFKEYIAGARRAHPDLLRRIAQRMLTALESASARRLSPRDRLAVGQLLYFLGVTGNDQAIAYLEHRLDQEEHPWFRRSIVIGLAFAGRHEPLCAYVDALREERRDSPPHSLNEANLGFHYSFFGDQPLDPAQPDRNAETGRYEQTVTSLIYQIQRPVTSGSWLIDLYTLIDLWQNVDPAAHRCVETSIAKSRDRLTEALGRLSADPAVHVSPDLPALRSLLAAAPAPP